MADCVERISSNFENFKISIDAIFEKYANKFIEYEKSRYIEVPDSSDLKDENSVISNKLCLENSGINHSNDLEMIGLPKDIVLCKIVILKFDYYGQVRKSRQLQWDRSFKKCRRYKKHRRKVKWKSL